MTQEKATVAWTKDDPIEEGVYWWRADAADFEPDIHQVVRGRFYEVGEQFSREVEGFGGEWLGPITADNFNERNALLSEVAQLREALKPFADLITEMESAKMQPRQDSLSLCEVETDGSFWNHGSIDLGDLRTARALLGKER